MKIVVTSIPVDDQEKALQFYTQQLGFIKKEDVPVGPYRWLTVVAPEGTQEVELLLEPKAFPPSQVYYKALFEANIPVTSFGVTDIQQEYERLEKQGVVFRKTPTRMGPVTIAVFEDTVGNLVQIAQRDKA